MSVKALFLLYNWIMKSFKENVLAIVSKISKGKVLTYKQVARMAGRPKAWRAVGSVLNKNRNPEIPCHRVIRSDGKAGGYNLGQREKLKRLKKEGVEIK